MTIIQAAPELCQAPGSEGLSAVPPPSFNLQKKARIVSDTIAGAETYLQSVATRAIYRLKVVSALVDAGWLDVADKVEGCGKTARKMRCKDCGGEWVSPIRCHHRICPDCGRIRATRLYNAHEHLTGRPHLKHLVLTLKNTHGLSWRTVPDLRSYFTKLRRRQPFRTAWRGGLYSIEFTYTEKTGWHIHIHALVDGAYVPQAVISKAWLEITGSSEVVWISRVKNSRQVLKYILKPGMDLLQDPAALDNFLTVVQGRHLVSGWGKWYRVTERWLMGDVTCPFCGSDDIWSVGHGCVWSAYYGKWVERSPPRGYGDD